MGASAHNELLVAFLLPAFGRHVLVEVALRVHEPYADERHAKVGGLLAVVARQHAKPAGIDGQRLMQGEFSREVGDGRALEMGERARPPRVSGASGLVQVS